MDVSLAQAAMVMVPGSLGTYMAILLLDSILPRWTGVVVFSSFVIGAVGIMLQLAVPILQQGALMLLCLGFLSAGFGGWLAYDKLDSARPGDGGGR